MNPLHAELKDQVVLLHPEFLVPNRRSDARRRFLCLDGFGCHPYTIGTKIYGHFEDQTEAEAHMIPSDFVESFAPAKPPQ